MDISETTSKMFENQTENKNDDIAVIASDKTLTYDELNRLSNRIAHSLIEKGIQKGDIVAFALPRRGYLIAVMFGILKSGAAYLPIDPKLPQERIEYILSDSKSRLFITEESIDELTENKDNTNPDIQISEDDICYCIYTSGSTGKPKGVTVRHKNIVNFCTVNENNCHTDIINKGTRILSILNPCFDAFGIDSLLMLSNGKSIIFADENTISDGQALGSLGIKYNADILHLTPTMLKSLCAYDEFTKLLKNIKIIIVAAEAFPPDIYDILRRYTKCDILNGYGPSEATIGASVGKISDADITIGKPIANTQIYIVDKYMKITPIGVTGELCIAGDDVGAGYLNRPELTAEKFIDNPFGEGKLYKTGDLAYWRNDGKIVYIGRNDFQVKIRGLRIELGEIENAICSVGGVLQSVVVVRKDEAGRQLICAFYTETAPVDLSAIKSAILSKLPKYMLPHIFTKLDLMPLTPSGKINRKALPEVDLHNIANDVQYVMPKTQLEKGIAKLMEEVLEYSPIGLNDDFFDLGGDSLKAIEFVSKAHNEGIYFSLQAIFDNPTVKQLCAYIENGDKTEIKYNKSDFAPINKVLKKNTVENISVPQASDIGNILLAGATGYLGIHILANFLDNDYGIAYCLVRGADKSHSENRLKELLNFYFGNRYECLFGDRIIVLCSDLTNDSLGMTEADYNSLENGIDAVINAAASVKHYGSYKYFYETNVETVMHLIDFCKKSGAKLIHASTLSVSGNSFGDEFDGYVSENEKHFYESSLYIEQPLENVYARSKFEAEKIILEEMSNGFKANIMRMGNLTNRYSDGKFQKNYESNAFLQRVRAILNLGIFPDYLMDLYAEFTPIDDAANAVMTISRHFSTEQTVFHINSTKVVYMDKLIEYFRRLGVSLKVVDGKTFTEALRQTAKQTDSEFIFETFINDMDNDDKLNYDSNIRIENDFTVAYLKKLGFEWSDIDFEYIKKYVEYFRNIGYLEV